MGGIPGGVPVTLHPSDTPPTPRSVPPRCPEAAGGPGGSLPWPSADVDPVLGGSGGALRGSGAGGGVRKLGTRGGIWGGGGRTLLGGSGAPSPGGGRSLIWGCQCPRGGGTTTPLGCAGGVRVPRGMGGVMVTPSIFHPRSEEGRRGFRDLHPLRGAPPRGAPHLLQPQPPPEQLRRWGGSHPDTSVPFGGGDITGRGGFPGVRLCGGGSPEPPEVGGGPFRVWAWWCPSWGGALDVGLGWDGTTPEPPPPWGQPPDPCAPGPPSLGTPSAFRGKGGLFRGGLGGGGISLR